MSTLNPDLKEPKNKIIYLGILGLVGFALIATMGPALQGTITTFPIDKQREEDEAGTAPFPLPNPRVLEPLIFPVNSTYTAEGFITSFPLEDQQITFSHFPLEAETGLVMLEVSRGPYEFPTRVKLLAWGNAIASGQIPENANPDDYHFHHIITVALMEQFVGLAETPEAQARLIAFAKSIENCFVIHRDDHVDLHRAYSEEELYEITMNGISIEQVLALLGQ